MTSGVSYKPIIVALDFPEAQQTLQFIDKLDPDLCRLKVGFELFVSVGPALIQDLIKRNFDVFLDLKFHDIPNTVAAACVAASKLGVWMLNVHAAGGLKMMSVAQNAIKNLVNPPKLIAVTVLTSLDNNDLNQTGINRTVHEQTVELARLVKSAGLDGVVCSAQEVELLRRTLGEEFLLVAPGIRLHGGAVHDQKRIMSPVGAVHAGANFLVIGRPITQAEDPSSVLRSINYQIKAGAFPKYDEYVE